MLIAVIVLLKLLGVVGGGTMFAFGVAGENEALTAGGMLVVVLSALVGPRRRDPQEHH
jgi:hypothetical protein